MQITAKVISETGIEKLSVAMQTKANLQRAKVLGLNFELEPSPNDLMAVFEAQNEDEALKIFANIISILIEFIFTFLGKFLYNDGCHTHNISAYVIILKIKIINITTEMRSVKFSDKNDKI